MLALLGVLLLASVARADTVFLEAFADANAETTTAVDPFLMTEGCSGGGSVDADMRLSTDRDHNGTNGGHASGRWAAFLDVASGESRCYLPNTSALVLSADELTVGVNLHLPAIPATAWTPVALMSGANRQCAVQITTSGTLLLYHGTTATSFGTSATILRDDACANDPYRPCASGSDCTDSAACTSCTASTSAGCFMPTIEVHQRNIFQAGGNQVVCDLWISGVQEVAGVAQASGSTIGTIDSVHLGAPGTEAVVRQAYFDDLVISTSDRAHHGWIASGYPTTDGVVTWPDDDCASAVNATCLDDWTNGAQYNAAANDDTVRQPNADRTDDIARFSDMTPADTASVTAVARLLTGITSADAGTWTYDHATLVCDTTTSCVATSAVGGSTTQLASHVVLGYGVNETAPGSSIVWSPSVLNKVGLRYRLITRPNNSNFRFGGALLYARGELADEPLPSNLVDHNLGADDGLIVVCGAGDSLAGGTLAAVCQEPASNAGTACSQDTYCSWDAPNGISTFGDLPSGGCSSDDQCQTCTGRREEVNAGAGYQCDADAECGSLGTCSTGICTQNTRISCSVDADCQGLGTCATTATCDDACPGGDCPDRVFWPFFLGASVNSDFAVSAGQGNETSWQFRDNRLEEVLLGINSQGVASRGEGVCACTVNGDCGTGGTCTNSRCVAGDSNRVACSLGGDFTGGDCADGFACIFPPCDYLAVMESPNDVAGSANPGDGGMPGPNCSEAGSMNAHDPTGPCDTCGAPVPCIVDSTCTAARGADSKCVGASFLSDEYPCIIGGVDRGNCATPQGPCGVCTAKSQDCKADSECPSGQTCSVNEPTEAFRRGYCECQTDGDCGDTNVWECITCASNADCGGGGNCTTSTGKCAAGSNTHGTCRRKGSSDATCSEPDRAGAYNSAAGVCAGTCTCPCSHTACTTSADCPVVDYPTASNPGPRTYRGDCVGGQCTNCGPSVCNHDADTAGAFRRFTKPLIAFGMSYQFQRMQDFVDQYPDPDGKPVLIFSTQPEYPRLPLTAFGGVRQLGNACDFAAPVWQDWGYLQYHSQKTLARFPHVADLRTLMRGRCRNQIVTNDACAYHVDAVHTLEAGARVIGAEGFGDVLAELNTCTTGTGVDRTRQKYCRQGDGDYTTTPCSTLDDCDAGERCEVKVCTVNDDTTANGCPGSPICNLE